MRKNVFSLFKQQQQRQIFVVTLKYIKPLTEIEKYLPKHREFLNSYYKEGAFLVSGPQVPRTGGVIVSSLTCKSKLKEILAKDPFFIHAIASYDITEFRPTKCHETFSQCIKDEISPEDISRIIVR